MGLAVIKGETKYMLPTSKEVRRINSLFTADNHTFDTVNDVSLEIKHRLPLANKGYYSLNGQFSNRDFSRTTKLKLYRMLISPEILYGVEA